MNELCSPWPSLAATLAFLVAIILSSTTTFWLLLVKRARQVRKPGQQLLPEPWGLPIVGYLPFLGSNLHQVFMELARIYGPIYKITLGTRLYVIINSPSLVKEVVRDHDIVFANRNPNIAALAFSYGGNDIAFSPYGPKWRKLRRLFVREMQSSANLDAFYDLRRNEVWKSIEDVCGKSGTPIDVGELAFVTVVNMISGMFWGRTLKGGRAVRLGGEFRSAAFRLTKVLGRPNVSDFFPFLASFDLQGVERDMKEVTSWLGRIFDFVITRCEEVNNEGKEKNTCDDRTKRDFLQFLMEYEDEDEENCGRSISKDQIKALLMDIVVGGTDTTSTTVEWTMTEILLNPQVLRRIHEELNDVVGSTNTVEESHISRLPYLHAVVKETMRLHPVAPLLLPRSPTQSCTVGGFTVPQGCKVFLNAWAVHRDPQYWDDPSEFRPERFLTEGKYGKLSYSGDAMYYLPFGSGRRICAGLQLGERMLMYVLATLLHVFDWEVPEGVELDSREKFGVVLEKATPLVAIPTPRSPARRIP
ncbi:flavonoid 3',5'-hydroxylase 1-like [Punica granatum]|uniref:Flavonoid 3',5'-hydroxylase 1-like n=1 Tax=Punica granatum TaxID=22663 RepID=A0A6P8D9W2_PUNGR|nr:flavonoid 3',5'-hydroxylase 1-like [Punica granatum]